MLRVAGKGYQPLWGRHQGWSNLNTHFGGWANWHPLAWFSADVAAVYSGTQTHSPGEKQQESEGQDGISFQP